jgi:hypothetical protein
MEFYRRFEPAVEGCRNFSLKDDAFAPAIPTLPAKLAEILKDPESRSSAWRFLGIHGFDGVFSENARHALCAGLLTYTQQDRDECINPIIEMALYASERRDMTLYKAVGEVVRSAGLASDISASTVAGFCHLSSYNALHERHFHPWIEIFAASNKWTVYDQIGNTLEERVTAQKHSTYDHLLRTLCRANSSLASAKLHTLVVLRPPPESDTIPKPHLVKMVLDNGIRFGAIGIAAQVVTSGVQALFGTQGLGPAVRETLASPVVWVIGVTLGALAGMTKATAASIAHERIVDMNERYRAQFKSSAFLFFAERVYARLGEAVPHNRFAAMLREDMELCGLYESVMSRWSNLYPLGDSTEGVENGASD